MFRHIRQEEENTVQALNSLKQALQAHKSTAERERDKFDKAKKEQRSGALLQNLDFDRDFGAYKTHAQSIKLCRETIHSVDVALKNMTTSFTNTHYRVISQTPVLLEHGQATRQRAMSIVVRLDNVMRDPAIFQVYEVFDMLGDLATYLDNWCFVIEQMLDSYNSASQYLGS